MKVTNIVFDGVDHRDAPDYADCFIVSCDIDGQPATARQIEAFKPEFVHDVLMYYLY